MNNKLESIAEESMVHVPNAKGLHTRTFSLEKFAHLLLDECIRISNEQAKRYTDSDRFDVGYTYCAEIISDKISALKNE